MRLATLIWTVAALAFCLFGFGGCNGQKGSAKNDSRPGDVILNATSHSDVNPENLPYTEGVLILRGSEVPVDLEVGEGSDFVLLIKAHGAVLDSETYRLSDEGIGFLGLMGEEFVSPIPIIKYPVRDGDTYSWEGAVVTGGESRDCWAEVTIKMETLNLPIGVFEAIRADVDLEMESGAEEPAKRELIFWIVPDHGVMKTQFGHSYTRQPRSTLVTESP